MTAPLVSSLLNVFQAVVSPVPGVVIPYVNGAVFGIWMGTLITWIGGGVAASTCFWIARTVGQRVRGAHVRRGRAAWRNWLEGRAPGRAPSAPPVPAPMLVAEETIAG